MSETLELETLMKAAGNKNVGTNAQSVMGALTEANKVLGEFQKTVNMLRGMGIFPMLIRVAGKKYGVDAETPLRTESIPPPNNGLIPSSTAHGSLMSLINSMNEQQLLELAQKMSGKTKDASNTKSREPDDPKPNPA